MVIVQLRRCDMLTKIWNWLKRNLDLILMGALGIIIFFLGQIAKLPGPVNKTGLRYFKDIDEVKRWYSSRFLPYWMVIHGDCDDKAEYVQQCALNDGFILSLALLRNGQYYKVDVSRVVEPHCGILALLGNGQFWYLEHNNGKFCYICNRD